MLNNFGGFDAAAASADAPQTMDSELVRARSFWRHVQRFEPGSQLNRQGRLSGADKIAVISGWACEYKLLADGRRQIFGFLLPHEVATLPGTDHARRNILALTRMEVIDWACASPELGSSLTQSWEQSEEDRQSRMFDQMIRLGRLSAEERMLNLFLDLYHRVNKAGLVRSDTLRMPLTQELLADALGLSVVHINRTVQKLKAKGYITLRSGFITLHRPQHLARLACYEPPPSVCRLADETPLWQRAS